MELAKFESLIASNNAFLKRIREKPILSSRDEHDLAYCGQQTSIFEEIAAAYRANDLTAVETAKSNLESWIKVYRTACIIGGNN